MQVTRSSTGQRESTESRRFQRCLDDPVKPYVVTLCTWPLLGLRGLGTAVPFCGRCQHRQEFPETGQRANVLSRAPEGPPGNAKSLQRNHVYPRHEVAFARLVFNKASLKDLAATAVAGPARGLCKRRRLPSHQQHPARGLCRRRRLPSHQQQSLMQRRQAKSAATAHNPSRAAGVPEARRPQTQMLIASRAPPKGPVLSVPVGSGVSLDPRLFQFGVYLLCGRRRRPEKRSNETGAVPKPN